MLRLVHNMLLALAMRCVAVRSNRILMHPQCVSVFSYCGPGFSGVVVHVVNLLDGRED